MHKRVVGAVFITAGAPCLGLSASRRGFPCVRVVSCYFMFLSDRSLVLQRLLSWQRESLRNCPRCFKIACCIFACFNISPF